jgi:hypothetical protein
VFEVSCASIGGRRAFRRCRAVHRRPPPRCC